MVPRARLSALGCLLVGWAVSAGCGGADDAPPPLPRPPGAITEVDLREPLTCDDLGTINEWGQMLCETQGNSACEGEGEATSDCARCCPAPLPTSQELASQRGWAAVACENDEDGSCNGLGEPTFDCDVACEAPATPPTCAQVAAEWGFAQAVCEAPGNGACGGKGVVTSDCARCCDAPPAAEGGAEFGDQMPEFNEEPEDDEEPTTEPPPGPGPGPAPTRTCGEIGTESGWANAVCETSSNKACGGKGVPSVDCKLCCEGTDGSGTGTPAAQGTLNVATYNLTGATKKQLYAVARALRQARPTVIGLQEATESQMNFLADHAGTAKMPMDYRHFAPVRKEGAHKVGIALVSKLPLEGIDAESLPGGGKLLRAVVTTPAGEFPFGTAWLGDSASAAARLKKAMGGAHALVAIGFEPGATQSALKVLQDRLSDGWGASFGDGATTVDGKRPDVVVKSGEWSGTLKGQVVGAAEGSTHRAVMHSYDPEKLGAQCQGAGCRKVQNPVMDTDFADPVIVRQDSTYFGFATGGTVVRRAATDLDTWTERQDAITRIPGWQENTGKTGLWAPAVYQARDGKWIMYYAAQVDGPSEQRCIGKAKADAPGALFEPDGKFICDSRWSIDPSVFSQGKRDYLLWRQDTAAQPSGNVWIQRLDDRGDRVGSARELLSRSTSPSSWEFDGQGGVMENPAMVLRNNVYHLFYSANRWETARYANGHAVCKTPTGPCTRTSVKKPWRGSKGAMKGPGGADVVKTPGGTTLMYMHGWEGSHVGPDDKEAHRKLWIFRLKTKGRKAKLKPY